MFGSEILEIAVGLAFVYLILSLVVTAVTEVISRLTALRSKNLYKGVQNLIGEYYPEEPADADGKEPAQGAKPENKQEKNADDFFDTPIIKSLTQPLEPKLENKMYKFFAGRPRPGYITSKRFFQGLIQTFGEAEHKIESVDDIQGMIDRLPDGDLKKNLTTILRSAGTEVSKFEEGVRDWFDDSMDRVSGWFKRQAHTITIVVAFSVTIIFNASTINIAEVLWNDDARRAAVTKLAVDTVEEGFGIEADNAEPTGGATDPAGGAGEDGKGTAGEGEGGGAGKDAKKPAKGVGDEQDPSTTAAIDQGRRVAEIITETSALPLGWKSENPFHRDKINPITKMKVPGWDTSRWISHFLGWMLTAFALTLGAPFWFDTLKRVVNLRTSGVSPEESATKKQKIGS